MKTATSPKKRKSKSLEREKGMMLNLKKINFKISLMERFKKYLKTILESTGGTRVWTQMKSLRPECLLKKFSGKSKGQRF